MLIVDIVRGFSFSFPSIAFYIYVVTPLLYFTITNHALVYTHTFRYVFGVTSGVMCLDIHPENAFLVAVGLYDGKVAVYDFREVKNPVFQSDARTGKHTDPVWQVRGHDPCT